MHIDESHPWRGRKLSELWDDRDRMLIYYLPTNTRLDLVTAVVNGHSLQVGDRLIIGTKPTVQAAQQRSFSQRLNKLFTGLKYLRHHSQGLLASILLLLVMIFISTLVYVSTILKTSPIDALYFSVSMITGAGDSLVTIGNPPDSLKLFTIFTMLIGAAIIGLSYALLNDFVLG